MSATIHGLPPSQMHLSSLAAFRHLRKLEEQDVAVLLDALANPSEEFQCPCDAGTASMVLGRGLGWPWELAAEHLEELRGRPVNLVMGWYRVAKGEEREEQVRLVGVFGRKYPVG